MKANLIKWALTVAAAAVSALPMTIPSLQPFAGIFTSVAGMLIGAAHFPQPGAK